MARKKNRRAVYDPSIAAAAPYSDNHSNASDNSGPGSGLFHDPLAGKTDEFSDEDRLMLQNLRNGMDWDDMHHQSGKSKPYWKVLAALICVGVIVVVAVVIAKSTSSSGRSPTPIYQQPPKPVATTPKPVASTPKPITPKPTPAPVASVSTPAPSLRHTAKPKPPPRPETNAPAGDDDDDEGDDAYIPLLPPPGTLARDCSVESLKTTTGHALCKEACSASKCCQIPAGLPNSCFDSKSINATRTCLEYRQECYMLEMKDVGTSSMKEPNLPVDSNGTVDMGVPDADTTLLETACAVSNLKTVEGVKQCQAVCEKAKCCFANGSDSCIEDDDCLDYNMCLHLQVMGHESEMIPKLVNEHCTEEKLKDEVTALQCETVCSNAMCCFEPVEECGLESKKYCLQYANCSVLYEEDDEDLAGEDGIAGTKDDLTAKPTLSPVAPHLITKDRVDLICTKGNVLECLDVCADGACCVQDTCTKTPAGLDCDIFESC